ncbi:C1 family peptidase [Oceanivirga miroungae]|uniref:Aminopeptidase n=1 Tax=Oceanivirga miroungae TaxID=1130046 RepID=A0A6I8M7A6_9FUSO|nr:C1 family peptidase [Oceanivirga miroungae]VWL85754.1 Aminopeptidase E [Oceanivirga miroungae]
MVDLKLLDKFEKMYNEDKTNLVIENAIARVGIDEASLKQNVLRKHNFVFSNEVKNQDVTNQKRSGRCWMFSGLNVLRAMTKEKLNVENFEFSQSYLQFYDKIEKSNSYLEYVVETKDLDIMDRLASYIVSNPAEDGGYWNFFQGLVLKYGVVPKEIMPETFHSSDTTRLNEMLELRLKKAAVEIRKEKSDKKIEKIKEKALYDVYNICVKAIGLPPKEFSYEYYDKDKKFHSIKDMDPKKFLSEYVGVNVEDKIQIVHDPRENYEVGRIYRVPYTVSVYEYGPTSYLTVSMEELKKATIKSIKDNIPVWFACDVAKESHYKTGIMDPNLFDYDNTLTELGEFSKADRLLTNASVLTHAMTFVGVDLDENENAKTWKVENSWGDEIGKKGIFSMSDDWFEKHNYECVVDKKYISEEYLSAFEKEEIVLPWYDNYLG